MDFSKALTTDYEIKANKTLSLICRISALFLLIIILLNAIGLFKITWIIYPILGAFGLILLLPTLFYNFLNKHDNYLRYIFLTLLVVATGIMYAILDYHVILMFVFPVLIAALYLDRKVMLYTTILGLPTMVISHVFAFILNQNFHLVTDEPATTWFGLFVYGLTPRLLEYIAFSIVGFSISTMFINLVKNLKDKNNEVYIEGEKIIKSLSILVDHDSHETGDHINRVSKATFIMCKKLGMSDEQAWTIGTAAMMHDIGKIKIDNKTLEKPGPLTEEEYKYMQTHTTIGYELLKDNNSEIMKAASVIAYQHHEKFDGTGYPNNLKGEEISLYARIVSICDVYDAIVSKRSYKPAKPSEEAVAFLIEEKDRKFDSKLVDVFLECLDEIKKLY